MALLPFLLVLVLALAVAAGVAFARREPPSRETTVAAARAHAAGTSAPPSPSGRIAAVGSLAAGLRMLSGAGSLGLAALSLPWPSGSSTPSSCCWGSSPGRGRQGRSAGPDLSGAVPGRGAATGCCGWRPPHRGRPCSPWCSARLWRTPTGAASVPAPHPSSRRARARSPAGPTAARRRQACCSSLRRRPRPSARSRTVRPSSPRRPHEAALRRASAHRVLRVRRRRALFITGGLLLIGGHALHSARRHDGRVRACSPRRGYWRPPPGWSRCWPASSSPSSAPPASRPDAAHAVRTG